jgi:hypothetical protein
MILIYLFISALEISMIYDPNDASPTASVENMWNHFILTELRFLYKCLRLILSKHSF